MDIVLIKDNLVEAVISADTEYQASLAYPLHLCKQSQFGATVGWGYNPVSQEFIRPVPPPEVSHPSITKLEFLRRFPTAKRIGIRIAATSDPVLADALGLLELAQDINTNDIDTQMLVGYCVQQGHLSLEESATILQ